mgnify:CR=1 FL=1
MQVSNYIKLNHVLEPKNYQGCNFDPLEIDYYNPRKKDATQREFFKVKTKFARQQIVNRS